MRDFRPSEPIAAPTLKEDRDKLPWEPKTEPVIGFVLSDGEGTIVSHPFFRLLKAKWLPKTSTCMLIFETSAIHVMGPQSKEFLRKFQAHQATMLQADGKGIVSVREIEAPRRNNGNQP